MYPKSRTLMLSVFCLIWTACDSDKKNPSDEEDGLTECVDNTQVSSPSENNTIVFSLENGAPYYAVTHEGQDVVLPSKLGFVLNEGGALDQGFSVMTCELNTFDETWTQPWGEEEEIRNNYNEMRVGLQETGGDEREMTLVFRAFDDGIAFRYEIPEQANLSEFEIMDEETEFVMAGDHQAWWIPAYGEQRYEYLYTQSSLSEMEEVTNPETSPEIEWGTMSAAHTPLTMRTEGGLHLSIHEAALTDYASMTLIASLDNTLLCDLVPWSDGVKVKTRAPMKTPWRTLQIGESAGDLITSYLILNLNEPNKLEDISWIEPEKYIGIWWAMHINYYSFEEGDKHGATTENAMMYMDFAEEHGFPGVLIEGWNVGWTSNWMNTNGEEFVFTESTPDFDLQAVAEYGAEHGVKIVGYHETGGGISNYASQMEAAYELYQEMGVTALKVGFVSMGQGIERLDANGELEGMEWHHGQWMVRFYRQVVETAAEYGFTLCIHEPIKDTGERRTYPNMFTREGARGQEYNAWDGTTGGNPPNHTTILPFTRLLSGPMDYTPGIVDMYHEIGENPWARVQHTLAKELALYVVIYSPLQMAADVLENYQSMLDEADGRTAFQFILDVAVDWSETRVLEGEIGELITIARKERDGDEWFLGSITNEEGRTLSASLDFLDADTTYVAEIYKDAEDADWDTNPHALETLDALVTADTTLELILAPGGGQAVRLRPATGDDIDTIPAYEK